MSYLEIYCDKILSGEIIACEKIKVICKKLKHDIHHPGKWHFDEEIDPIRQDRDTFEAGTLSGGMASSNIRICR